MDVIKLSTGTNRVVKPDQNGQLVEVVDSALDEPQVDDPEPEPADADDAEEAEGEEEGAAGSALAPEVTPRALATGSVLPPEVTTRELVPRAAALRLADAHGGLERPRHGTKLLRREHDDAIDFWADACHRQQG